LAGGWTIMGTLDGENGLPGESVKYAQQHLANERTYLAWIRTAVSIIGVGFLTTSLHFTIRISSAPYINTIAVFLGIFACMVGITTAIMSTIQYSRKRIAIKEGKFVPSHLSIIFISILFSLLIIIILLYLSFLLFM
jgi:putative membrane protein